MSKAKIYGIKNCDTMKKTFAWLADASIEYEFHDYKKHGADCDLLIRAFETHDWENVINRRGMTWRKLPDDLKNSMDHSKALEIAQDKPSIIKRPILTVGDKIYLGFSPDHYDSIFDE
mgnify:CR=1 FL=1